jgi:hypothetical protein
MDNKLKGAMIFYGGCAAIFIGLAIWAAVDMKNNAGFRDTFLDVLFLGIGLLAIFILLVWIRIKNK